MAVGRKPKTIRADGLTRAPYVPRHLAEDAAAEWRRVIQSLVERRIISDADLGTLENYCVQIGIARECERIIAREGLMIVTRMGEPKRHPASSILKDAVGLAKQLAGELGLTPVSRSRPAVREDDADDLLDL